jgi:hypothetical protein
VRDEIRMIRPGLYLGRAYLDRGFALNFTLYDKATDEQGARRLREDRQGAGGLLAGTQCAVPPRRASAKP